MIMAKDGNKADTQKSERPTAQIFRLVGADPSKEEIKKALLPRQMLNQERPANAVAGNAFQPEDEYQDLYVGASRDIGVLEPPYNLSTLDRLAQENNALSPCIEAMVTNIDGTGYDFIRADAEEGDDSVDEKIEQLRQFFAEPWPGESFMTIRQKLRRDYERTGNAYLEVLRNAQDQIVFLRHVDAKMMRLLKLDDPVPVEKVMRRNGREVRITVMERQRRYVQLLNGVTLVYFKDFGVQRDLNKNTGVWAQTGQRLPANQRATEIIHFTCLPDSKTPYGVPRWINQLPSILGSRRAEEFNLEFFDNGGVPPVLIILQGGSLQDKTRQALEQKMSLGSALSKNRVQVLEVEPTGGSMDHPLQAKVTVERFGSERQNDSMFEKYDDKCEQRIRRAFRLPPIFVGQAADYAFATAYVSYNVAEAQVFKPERDEFDEVISMKLLTAMGYYGYRMKSKPMVIDDASLKMQGIELAMNTNHVMPSDIIREINEVAKTRIRYSEEPVTFDASMTVDEEGNIVHVNTLDNRTGTLNGDNGTPVEAPKPSSTQKAAPLGVLALAHDTLAALRGRDFAELAKHVKLIASLDERGRKEFQKACASLQFIDPSYDLEGLGELMSCTIAVMQSEHQHHH